MTQQRTELLQARPCAATPQAQLLRYGSRVLLAAIALMVGCEFQSADEPVLADNTCAEDDDCVGGKACQEGICVTTEHAPLVVALEIAPVYSPLTPSPDAASQTASAGSRPATADPSANASTALSFVVPKRVITGPTVLEDPVLVPLRAEVSGTVQNGDERVRSRISFFPLETIPGVRAAAISTTTGEERTHDSEGTPSDFVVRVSQNSPYEVWVFPLETSDDLPADPALPPRRVGDFIVAEGKTSVTRLNFNYDNNYDTYTPIERYFSVSNAPAGQRLRVRAVRADQPSIAVSSAYKMMGAGGDTDFRLLFTASREPYQYQLVITPLADPVDNAPADGETAASGTAPAPVYPVFKATEEDLIAEAELNAEAGLDAGVSSGHRIRIPTVPAPATFSGQVTLCSGRFADKLRDEDGSPPTTYSEISLNVSLRSEELALDGDETALAASFSTTTATREDPETGELRFSVEVIPGRYEVVVTPPSDANNCGVYAKKHTIAASPDGAQPEPVPLVLPDVSVIEGVVQTADGKPVSGATVQAQALGREGIDPNEQLIDIITRFNRSSQATTDEDGAFKLPVDLGSYDIIAKPPSGAGFAWEVFYDVNIGATNGEEFPRDIGLEVPVPVKGTLRYALPDDVLQSTAGLGGSEIRAFALITYESDDTRAVPIGRATADEDGDFTLLLSPLLRQGWY